MRVQKSEIKKTLIAAIPDLTQPAIKIVIESGNPYYFKTRAIELIKESELVPDSGHKLDLAILLLALAKLWNR